MDKAVFALAWAACSALTFYLLHRRWSRKYKYEYPSKSIAASAAMFSLWGPFSLGAYLLTWLCLWRNDDKNEG